MNGGSGRDMQRCSDVMFFLWIIIQHRSLLVRLTILVHSSVFVLTTLRVPEVEI